MTVDATLLLIAPEFTDVAQADREGIAALAALSVGTVFGDTQELATAYLAAHMLSIRQRAAGAGGSVKSLKEGDLAITYGGADMQGALNSTSYGQEYLRLRSQCVLTARTRIV